MSMYFQKTSPVDFTFNPLADRKFKFYDHSLIESIKLEELHVQEFFRLLSLCHTVMSEEKNEGLYGAYQHVVFIYNTHSKNIT